MEYTWANVIHAKPYKKFSLNISTPTNNIGISNILEILLLKKLKIKKTNP